MYIAPNSTIKILSGVPLDNTYEHTVYFENATVQYNMFNLFTKYNNVNYTYQRVNEGKIKVEKKADLLYDCNYLMFQNTNYGTKWFYAFITAVEFVNNETSEITYEIDPMQTWYFDYTVEDSFVEREHSETDEIGENLVPENLEIGDYVCEGERDLMVTSSMSRCVCVATTFKVDFTASPIEFTNNYVEPGSFGGIYSALNIYMFTDVTALNSFIFEATSKNLKDGIVAVWMMYTPFYQAKAANLLPQVHIETCNIIADNDPEDMWGFIPNNNKLRTFPYVFLYVTNHQGDNANFQFEYFSNPPNSSISFDVYGDCSPDPSLIAIPKYYKGALVNTDEKLSLKGFPQCAYATDAFMAWLAQSASSIAVNGIFGVAGAAASILAAPASASQFQPMGAGLSGIGSIANALAAGIERSTAPPQANGRGLSNGILYSSGMLNFMYTTKHIRPEFAHIIDEYFTVYGYATHRVKKPNIGTRPHWNYVKTLKVNLKGSVPANDMKKIASIYDNGITFWKYFSEIGDYSLDNRPT